LDWDGWAAIWRGGHRVALYNRAKAVAEGIKAEENGGEVAASFADVVAKLKAPRHVWIMLPAGEVTEQALREFMALLSPDDTCLASRSIQQRRGQRLECVDWVPLDLDQ